MSTDLDSLHQADILVNEFSEDEEVGVRLVNVHTVAVFHHLSKLSKSTRERRVFLGTAEHCYTVCQ